jgi:mannitol 2-dehydrogenase
MRTLDLTALPRLPETVTRPAYARAALSPGILHIGVGNFHRAHMAVYLDRLFSLGEGFDWAIVGAGLRPADATMRDRLAAQDWLSSVTDLDDGHASTRVTGAMIDFCPVDPREVQDRLCDPAIRILSMTVTEGGYFLDSDGTVMLQDPALQADIATPDTPRTVFGIALAALRRRRATGVTPFTVLSCDNLQGNGDATRRVTLALADAQDPDLGAWVRENVAFPNSMVDCITPRTGAGETALADRALGLRDAAPVTCEPFRQWVIEDHFTAGRPPLEKVGVTFVNDVSTHELMKLRLLNASHATLCYAAALRGHRLVHEAMQDAVIADYLRTVALRETIPTLGRLPGVDYAAYLDDVLRRFRNPAIGDTIARLAEDGSDRQPKFILPTIADALARGLEIEGLAIELAIWMRFCADPPFPIADPLGETLTARARDGAGAFLDQTVVFGALGRDERLRHAVSSAADALNRDGLAAVLKAYADEWLSGARPASPGVTCEDVTG